MYFGGVKKNMKPIEILKVFGYIFVLLLCFALMQGLSTFEFSTRDKTVTYEQTWVEDFSSDLDLAQWSLSSEEIKTKKKQLVFNLDPEENSLKATSLMSGLVDSGYVSVKVILPASDQLIKTRIELIHNSAVTIPLEIHEAIDEHHEFRSPLIFGQEIVGLDIRIHRAEVANNNASPIKGLVVEDLQYMKLVRPQKLF